MGISDEDSKPALENFAAIKIQAIARARMGKKKSAAKAGAMSSLISDVLAESPIGKAKVDALAAPQDDGAAVAPASPEQLEQPQRETALHWNATRLHRLEAT